ncbi:hypothetical protein PCC8801_2462 [Rippkaea orientalis PCC 8801]|uniref:Uncharacterized protein n=1 Tax=Rippkaea orientalis (strain PCC 8801 / RF-1) TaxID=41431 RepID=B7K3T2_RIPO1|nr:hypothetical protein PCC8801_2462 [Rippkaea orientalis PCC 8801]
MNTHDVRTHYTYVLTNDGRLHKEKEHPMAMVLLIFFGSLVIGAIPLIYGSMLDFSSSQVPTVPHEATLWE